MTKACFYCSDDMPPTVFEGAIPMLEGSIS